MSQESHNAAYGVPAEDPRTLLPENCIVDGEIRIIMYLGAEGEELYAFTTTEGIPFSRAIGLLTMVGHHLAHKCEGGWEDED